MWDKGFFKFIKEKKDVTKIAVALALGLVLIFIGTNTDTAVEQSDEGLEDKLAAACSGVAGVGKCSVLVYYSTSDSRTEESKVESVIVICEGADSAEVRLKLTEMLSSFFGIGTNRIKIEKMQG